MHCVLFSNICRKLQCPSFFFILVTPSLLFLCCSMTDWGGSMQNSRRSWKHQRSRTKRSLQSTEPTCNRKMYVHVCLFFKAVRSYQSRFCITWYQLYSTLLAFFGFPSCKSTWYLLFWYLLCQGSKKVKQVLKGDMTHCRPLIGQVCGVTMTTSYAEAVLSWAVSCNGKWKSNLRVKKVKTLVYCEILSLDVYPRVTYCSLKITKSPHNTAKSCQHRMYMWNSSYWYKRFLVFICAFPGWDQSPESSAECIQGRNPEAAAFGSVCLRRSRFASHHHCFFDHYLLFCLLFPFTAVRVSPGLPWRRNGPQRRHLVAAGDQPVVDRSSASGGWGRSLEANVSGNNDENLKH